MNSLGALRLLENNPHLKKLVIKENDNNNYAVDSRMITYFSHYCRELTEISLRLSISRDGSFGDDFFAEAF
jgi:hypothetical protein